MSLCIIGSLSEDKYLRPQSNCSDQSSCLSNGTHIESTSPFSFRALIFLDFKLFRYPLRSPFFFVLVNIKNLQLKIK
jgi:hypothetical protein